MGQPVVTIDRDPHRLVPTMLTVKNHLAAGLRSRPESTLFAVVGKLIQQASHEIWCALSSQWRRRDVPLCLIRYDECFLYRSAHRAPLSALRPPSIRHLAGRPIAPSGFSSDPVL
jgi:hypothetical protein